MQIQVTLPLQVTVAANAVLTCSGLVGTDTPSLNCSYNSVSRTISITNGFMISSTMPSLVTFSVSPLTNPNTTSITTDSFALFTKNYFGDTTIDSISQYLTVAFNCTASCKTCSGNSNTCTSCQGFNANQYFINYQCLSACPSTFYSDALNNCQQCASPCGNCTGSSSNCTSCVAGYSLSGNTCQNTGLFFSRYYFFASGAAVVLALFVLLVKCCDSNTKWL